MYGPKGEGGRERGREEGREGGRERGREGERGSILTVLFYGNKFCVSKICNIILYSNTLTDLKNKIASGLRTQCETCRVS